MYIRGCVLHFLKTHSKDAIKAVTHVAEWTPFPALRPPRPGCACAEPAEALCVTQPLPSEGHLSRDPMALAQVQ